MNIFYIADIQKHTFMYVSGAARPTLNLYRAPTIYEHIKECLISWYSPVNSLDLGATRLLPSAEPHIQEAYEMYLYNHNLLTNEVKRAVLPRIRFRFPSLSRAESVKSDLPENELIVASRELYGSLVFYEKKDDYLLIRNLSEVIIFSDIREN